MQPGVTGIENVEFGVPRLAANGAAMRINYQIDGNTNTEKDRAGLRLLPMSEVMIQEVKVVTTGFAPEFGQTMGMVFNAVTPSGTNTFRGEGRYLFRRKPFSAFPFFFGCIVQLAVAAALALGAGELVLRHSQLRPAGWLVPEDEPRQRPDPWLGWTLMPSRTGHRMVDGRVIDYAIDPAGYRVPRVDEPVESRAADDPVRWRVGDVRGRADVERKRAGAGRRDDGGAVREPRGARLQQRPGLSQTRKGATAFSTPHGGRVVVHDGTLSNRSLDRNRPHLGPDLGWLPTVQRGRLASLAELLVPFRSTDTVERGINVTRQVLGATVTLARARGATPLILVPQFGVEAPVERALRHGILDEAGLPYLWIEIDEGWRLSGDLRPNPQAAHAIATAVAARLQGR